MSAAGPWFEAPKGIRVGGGQRGQNDAAIATLLTCIRDRLSIHASHDDPPIRSAGGAGAWLFCQTSGSGGHSKTIRRSQASWIASFRVNRDAYDLSDRDRYAVLGALGHSLALYGSIEALHLGASLDVLAGDSPRCQIEQLAKRAITTLYATPTQLLRLQMAGQGRELPALRQIFCGGGRLAESCRDAMAVLCPEARLREFYGASETSFATIADDASPPGSVGRAYPGVRLQIRDGGEIWVASPYLFDGYAEAAQPPIRRDGDFVTLGDIGHLDDAGHLFLQGRQSRMVTVADRNLFLEDVEALLMSASGLLCAAIALPDALRGHAILAVIEGPPDDALAVTLRRACREALGEHAAPRRLRFVAQMPLLPSGKPDLAGLARWFAAGPA